jgi:hypothetical protein
VGVNMPSVDGKIVHGILNLTTRKVLGFKSSYEVLFGVEDDLHQATIRCCTLNLSPPNENQHGMFEC